jgi:hypothetical protein
MFAPDMMNIRARVRLIVLTAFVIEGVPGNARAQEEDRYDETDPSALIDFHATLDPVGDWVDDPTYGTVWVPNPEVVGPDFVPYASGGHWAYGDDYAWVSDYDWGWAPFHYGRWVYADGRGWSWIAGRQYAPAWVSWRVAEPGFGFVGWAPAPPSFLWRGGVAVSFGFPLPAPSFVYCGSGDIFHPHVFERIVRGPQVDVIAVRMHPFEERPGLGGHRFYGPPPARLGVEPGRIVRISGREPGIVHAREFGRPSVAVRYGAHPPTRAIERPVERGEGPAERPHGEAPMRDRAENHSPENRAPERRAPENRAPENRAPERRAPENRAPENRAPEMRHASGPPERAPAPMHAPPPSHAAPPPKHGR